AVAAWEQALRFAPGDLEATEALRQAASVAGEQPRHDESPPASASRTRVACLLRGRGQAVEGPFPAPGPVDRAILQEVWDRDVYGVRNLGGLPVTVVDVGAHIGAFSLLAAAAWPGARVLACEADPENCALLRENLAGRANVEVVAAAVVG